MSANIIKTKILDDVSSIFMFNPLMPEHKPDAFIIIVNNGKINRYFHL